MKAIVISRPGAPEVLELRDVPAPEPGPGEVLVRVRATAVNRADILQRRGRYPAPPGAPADIPGLEYAGTIAAVGAGVESWLWAEGDPVMGLVAGGGYAELVAVPADQLVPVPDRLDLEQAAAIPEVFITAHDALRTRLGLAADETLLVHAVGSGVGTAALQLAKAWGARVIGTARTGWKLERARELGLDLAIHTGADAASDASSNSGSEASDSDAGPAFADPVLEATEGRGADAILDLVGGAYLAGNLRAAATLGRIVVVGLTSGRRAELDMGMLLGKRLTVVGTVLRSRPAEEKARTTRAFADDVLPLLADGRVGPVIHEVLPVAEAARAHALVESNETFGKVLLSW